MTRHHALRAVSITALVLLLAAGFVRATTLLQLTFNELVSASERIFTGVVVDVTVTTEGDLVYSTVHFTVDAVIKVMQGNAANARKLIMAVAPKLGPQRTPCPLGVETMLDMALITAKEKRDPALVAKLDAVAGRVLKKG